MAEEIFQIKADLQPYILELRKAALESDKFKESSIKIIAALKRTDEGFVKLTTTLKATTKAGDLATITNIKIAESERKLKNTVAETNETLQVRDKIEKTREKRRDAERVDNKRILMQLAFQRKAEAEIAKFREQQVRDLRKFQEGQGNLKFDQRRFDRKKILAHTQALKDNVEWEKRKARAIQQGFIAIKRQAQAQSGATSATRRNTAALKKAETELGKHSELVKDITITWRSFFRLIALRIAAGSIVKLTSLIKDSTAEAIEFSRKIAEIQTIIKESEQTLGAQARITQRVIAVSARSNFELADTTEAFYDALSNQVSDSLKGIEIFTNTSIRLAKATVSTLEDSGNALVSVIQAFNLDFTQAESVAASLFNLVDRGRLRLDEIADTLGNVAVPAAALGVTFNELFATLANLTLQGISVNRSQTLLRNLFLKLQSPTETLRKTYREWGFETGVQAQEALQLVGVLIKLNEIELKTPNFLNKAFGRIRAEIAARGSIGENIPKIIEAAKEIEDGAERFERAVQLVRKSAGENIQKELRQFKLVLFEVFGVKILNLLNQADQNFKDLSDTLIKITVIGSSAAAAILLVGAAFGSVVFLIAAPIAALATFGVAVVGAVIGMKLLQDTGVIAFRRIAKEADEVRRNVLEKLTKQTNELTEALRKLGKQDFRDAKLIFAERRKILFQQEALGKKIVENVTERLEFELKITDALISSNDTEILTQQGIKETNKTLGDKLTLQKEIVSEAQRELDISLERQRTLAQDFESQRFERFIRNLNNLSQINARAARAGSLKDIAIDAFNLGNIEDARDAINEAVNQLRQADRQNFQIFGSNNFERQFRTLENISFEIERRFSEAQKQRKGIASEKAKDLETEIKNNITAFERQEKAVENVKIVLERIAEIEGNITLSVDARNELIQTQIGFLNRILGVENQISNAILLQILSKRELIRIQEAAKELGKLETRKSEADTAFAKARQQFDILVKEIAGAAKSVQGIIDETIEEALKKLKRIQLDPEDLAKIELQFGTLQILANRLGFISIKLADDTLPDSEKRRFLNSFQKLKTQAEDILNEINIDAISEFITISFDGIGPIFERNVDSLQREFSQAVEFIGEGEDILKNYPKIIQQTIDADKEVLEVTKEINQLAKDNLQAIKDLNIELEDLRNPVNEVENETTKTLKAIEETAKEISKEVELREEEVLFGSTILNQINEMGDAQENVTDEINKSTRAQELFLQSQERTKFRKEHKRKPEKEQGITVDDEFLPFKIVDEFFDTDDFVKKLSTAGDAQSKVREQAILLINKLQNQSEQYDLTAESSETFEQTLVTLKEKADNTKISYSDLAAAIRSARVELFLLNQQSNQDFDPFATNPIFRAGGGFIPRGTDTIPAMLTPGEFIVNAQSTLMNRSLLHLINSTKSPVRLARGGTVGNTFNSRTNVTLQSVSENIDATRIGKKIEQQNRRGILGKKRIYG